MTDATTWIYPPKPIHELSDFEIAFFISEDTNTRTPSEAERWTFLSQDIEPNQRIRARHRGLRDCLNQKAECMTAGYHEFYCIFPDKSAMILGGSLVNYGKNK